MQTFITRILRIRPEEQKQFFLLTLILSAIMAGLEVTSNIAEITFFRRVNIESLPYLYMIEPPVIIILLMFLGTLIDRFGRYRLLFILNGGMITGLLIARAFMQVNWSPIYPTLWLIQRVLFGTAPLVFWVLCSDVFDVRQSKRLFPIILTGSLVGATVGNFLTGLLSRYLVAEDILIGAAILFAVAVVGIESVRRLRLPTSFIHPNVMSERTITIGLPRHLITQPFLQALFLLMFIIGLLEPVLRFQLSAIANQTFEAEQSLITFFGFVKAGGALVIAIFQIAIASRLTEKLGVPTTLSILPVGFMILLPLLGLFPNVIVGAAVVASLVTLSTSFHGPARTSALNLFPQDERGRISAFADQLWYVGWFIGSAFLSWANTHLNLSQINFAAALVAAIWLLILPSLRQRYINACLKTSSLPIDQHFKNLVAASKQKGESKIRTMLEERFKESAPALRSMSPLIQRRAIQSLNPNITEPNINAQVVTQQLQHAFTLIALTTHLEPTWLWQKICLETEFACANASLSLLELTHPAQQIRASVRMVRNESPAMRAAGLEALESLIRFNGLKQHLIVLISGTSLEEKAAHAKKWLKVESPSSPDEALKALSQFPDPLVRLQSRHQLNQEKEDDGVELVNRISVLRLTKVFGALSEEELNALAMCATEHHFEAKHVIHEEGSPSQTMCVIVSGEVEIASAARHENIKKLSAGNVFGDISLMSQQPYALTAIALSTTEVLTLDRDTLNELGGYYPNIPFALTRYFALRLGNEKGFWREETLE